MKFFKKVLKNKLFYLLLILGVFVIPIFSFNLQAQEDEIIDYSNKNLAVPDLAGKEYLGDGVYRLYDDNGITIDYNVNNGIYTMNGIGNTVRLILFNIEKNTEYTLSYIYVTGTLTGGNIIFEGQDPQMQVITVKESNYNENIENTFNTNEQTRIDLVIGSSIRTFNNFQYKVQLEKGDTATPYTVPGQIPQYKIVGEE